ncbi:5087_t:CDS:1, partial [Cetraspora pellucida]
FVTICVKLLMTIIEILDNASDDFSEILLCLTKQEVKEACIFSNKTSSASCDIEHF